MTGCCMGCDAVCVYLPWDSTQWCGESPPALLHCFICPMGVLWSGEMSVNWRSCVPPLGAEVVLREGLKRSLCEEAVQMYFLSCINQLEGSKGS